MFVQQSCPYSVFKRVSSQIITMFDFSFWSRKWPLINNPSKMTRPGSEPTLTTGIRHKSTLSKYLETIKIQNIAQQKRIYPDISIFPLFVVNASLIFWQNKHFVQIQSEEISIPMFSISTKVTIVWADIVKNIARGTTDPGPRVLGSRQIGPRTLWS